MVVKPKRKIPLHIEKKTANDLWDMAFNQAIHGNLNREQLFFAMGLLNQIDQELIKENKRELLG